MKINSDFRDLLPSLNAAGTRRLIVGGYAVMAHTEPRHTKDLDICVEPERENAARLLAALSTFDVPLEGIQKSDSTETEVFFQIGIEPVRIDVMTSVKGLEFGAAWERKIAVDFGGVSAPVLSRQDILVSKVAADPAQDRLDARNI